MSAFPSLPLFTDAWVADTKHLSRLERGTYHDLLILMWRTAGCRVPNDDAWLARRMAMTVEEVTKELRPIIAEFCHADEKWITQKRLTREYQWCSKKSEQRSEAAKSKWKKEKEECKRNAETPPPRNAPNLSSPTEEKKDSDPNGSDATASRDVRKDLFGKGLETLARITGKTPDSSRSLVGKWLKSVNDEAIHVLAAIENAERNRIADPVAWINRALSSHIGDRHGKRTVQDAARELVEKFGDVPTADGRPASGAPVRLLSSGGRQ